MEIGSIIDILRTFPETAALKPGDLLKVKVLEVFEHQRVLVDLGRFRTMAAVTFPLVAGDEIWVRVQETQNRLRLQLAPAPGDPPPSAGPAAGPVQAVSAESLRQVQVRIDQLAGVLQRLPDSQPMPPGPRQVLDALRLYLDPFEPGSGPDAVAGRLREFCDECGLFLEPRLAAAVKKTADRAGGAPAPDDPAPGPPGRLLATDLKARLLVLKNFLDSSVDRQLIRESREMAGLARAATELLADIRAGQEQIAKPASASQPFQMVHFALPMADERHQAQLKIAYRRRRGTGKKEGHRAAVLLQLDRMGAVRADLLLLSRSLSISIFVSNAGLRNLVTRHVPEVREALSAFFEQVGVQVSVSSRKIARFAAEDWLPAGETQVDVRV